jgi:hypothetical protein
MQSRFFHQISINFGFVVHSSKDSECIRRLSGLHSETSYALLRDVFSSTLYGAAVRRLSGMYAVLRTLARLI